VTRGRVSDAPPSLTPTPGVGGPAMTSVGMPTMGMPIQVPAGHDVLTIGVAIEVPEPFSSELRTWRADFGDQRARSIPTHVTLLPPTLVPRESFDEVAAHLGDLARDSRSFQLRLRGTNSFRPISPVVFVCVREGAVSCDGLQRRLRTGPLERELAFPFHPHVTVAQDVDAGSLDRALRTLSAYNAEFIVDSLGLYEHGPDGVWRHRQRFGFDGTG
jgi:2'-5' RNA ligase